MGRVVPISSGEGNPYKGSGHGYAKSCHGMFQVTYWGMQRQRKLLRIIGRVETIIGRVLTRFLGNG